MPSFTTINTSGMRLVLAWVMLWITQHNLGLRRRSRNTKKVQWKRVPSQSFFSKQGMECTSASNNLFSILLLEYRERTTSVENMSGRDMSAGEFRVETDWNKAAKPRFSFYAIWQWFYHRRSMGHCTVGCANPTDELSNWPYIIHYIMNKMKKYQAESRQFLKELF